MPERSKKRPPDPNRLAHEVVLESTWQAPEDQPGQADEQPKNPHAVALGQLGGLTGGPAGAESLSAKQRSAIAVNARSARRGEK